MTHSSSISKLTLSGVIVTLGIVYGDIGTSPLYVMKAIIQGAANINELLIFGAISCVFWTLTLQTTFKYVIITLKADNHGEGGIFALFALTKRKATYLILFAMIGGSALLADGVITPAITVTSAIEGIGFTGSKLPVIPIVLSILFALFFVQQFGTKLIGIAFGPIMLLWFLALGILGFNQIAQYPKILLALNPKYAIDLLITYPSGILLLGAVFLCTTGAEALYSDLGHCGLKNIRTSWIFVKITLVLNYFGQGAWILSHTDIAQTVNPFYTIMPDWFLIPGIILATCAAVIASQALITGSFTLISEASSLNFWPKFKLSYPTDIKGQVYIPAVNWFLLLACCLVVLYFEESSKMEAAYGLSISLTMIMTTLLLNSYMKRIKLNKIFRAGVVCLFIIVETTFLFANLHKFMNGGWFSLALAGVFFVIMYGWYFGRLIKNSYTVYVPLDKHVDIFTSLSQDNAIPKISSNLIYITKAEKDDLIESKILYSIFNKQPKRADIYWFLQIDNLDTPDTFEYKLITVVPGKVYKVIFKLGFKIERRINLYFRQVVEDLVNSGEVDIKSPYESLRKHGFTADFLFVNLDRVISTDYKLPLLENFIMNIHNAVKRISLTDVKSLNLDTSVVIEEKVPIMIKPRNTARIIKI